MSPFGEWLSTSSTGNQITFTSKDSDSHIFRNTSRKKVRSIRKYLHYADNANLTDSKVTKVIPLFNMIRSDVCNLGYSMGNYG